MKKKTLVALEANHKTVKKRAYGCLVQPIYEAYPYNGDVCANIVKLAHLGPTKEYGEEIDRHLHCPGMAALCKAQSYLP